MASLVLSGDTSGSITLAAPAVAGSTTQTLVAVTGTLAPIVSGTSVTCAGQTSIDFTGIPSWVKRITVMFSNVSTSGTSPIQVQLGDSGGFEITGYLGGAQLFINTGSIVYTNSNTAGLSIETAQANLTASTVRHGQIVLSLIGSNLWTMTSNMAHTGTTTAALGAGSKTLSDTLTQVRITTVNGTDTFDTTPSAGTINILYE